MQRFLEVNVAFLCKKYTWHSYHTFETYTSLNNLVYHNYQRKADNDKTGFFKSKD